MQAVGNRGGGGVDGVAMAEHGLPHSPLQKDGEAFWKPLVTWTARA